MKLSLECESIIEVGCDTCPFGFKYTKTDSAGAALVAGTTVCVPWKISETYTATARTIFGEEKRTKSSSTRNVVEPPCDSVDSICPHEKNIGALSLAMALNDAVSSEGLSHIVLPEEVEGTD